MIFTSYYANIKNIPKEYTKIGVSRYPLQNDNSEIIYLHSLSPSYELLHKVKNENIKFDVFVKMFREEKLKDTLFQEQLHLLSGFYFSDETVVLLCYEKDSNTCHRSIIAKMLNKFDDEIDVKEL